ncbi:MAG TPA: YlxR family protein [Gaiella sp.]|nr:YlxR family protein [Gaiella sp.]
MSLAGPVRTCVGCRRRAPQGEFLRFGVVDGVLTPGSRIPGRGAYTCRRLECFERALQSRAFPRALRRPVSPDPALARLYTEESHG